jgi:glycosyltransferase involved in cell wall biosynthesis
VSGGAEKHCEELYPRLAEMGYDITVLTRYYKFPTWNRVKFKKIPYIDKTALETMSHSIMCSLYCIKNKPDIVHIHNMGACLLVPLMSICGIRVVLTIHSLNYLHEKWNRIARWVLNFCELIGISFSHRIIIVSKEIIKFLSIKYQRPLPCDLIPNGISRPEYVSPGETLRKYGLTPKKYVLAVGRLDPVKGFDRLIDAYKTIPIPDYKLVIVGNDIKNKHGVELRLNKSDKIIFTGFLCGKPLAELYTNAGLFVSASAVEGFPIVVLEALSYGLPTLLSDILAHREIRLPNYRYFNRDNLKELALKIEELIQMGITEEEADKFKQILTRDYNWEAIARKTAEIYGR